MNVFVLWSIVIPGLCLAKVDGERRQKSEKTFNSYLEKEFKKKCGYAPKVRFDWASFDLDAYKEVTGPLKSRAHS